MSGASAWVSLQEMFERKCFSGYIIRAGGVVSDTYFH